MDTLLTIYANAFITLYFYIQMYFWHFALLLLTVIATIVEYKQKEFLYINDRRKVV